MKFFALMFLVAGCATVKDVTGPDGTNHKLVTCSSIESCYEDARTACGKYKIINSSSEASRNSDGSVSNSHDLLIKCEEGTKP